MKAIVSSPTSGVYVARFYYLIGGEGANKRHTDHTKPIVEVPCESYEQANATVNAFNRKA